MTELGPDRRIALVEYIAYLSAICAEKPPLAACCRLMTEVGPDRRIALVEYIAHLSVQDWQGVARDLVALGFAPEGA